MKKADLFAYMSKRLYAVEATSDAKGRPQSAVVGIAVTKSLHIVFDTLKTSRKYKNLKANPRIAFTAWDDETTLQYEGVAREITTAPLRKYKQVYFRKFPDGRDRDKNWPGLVHFVVFPKWARFSDFTSVPERIFEFKF